MSGGPNEEVVKQSKDNLAELYSRQALAWAGFFLLHTLLHKTQKNPHFTGISGVKADHRHRRLRTHGNRPPHRRAAEQGDELAAFHSITSSARASSVGGTSRPIVLAVCRLMTNSNLVGSWTGISAGFSPLRMRPT